MAGKGFRFGSRTADVNREVMEERARSDYEKPKNSGINYIPTNYIGGILAGARDGIYFWDTKSDNFVKLQEINHGVSGLCIHNGKVHGNDNYKGLCHINGVQIIDSITKKPLSQKTFTSGLISWNNNLVGTFNNKAYTTTSRKPLFIRDSDIGELHICDGKLFDCGKYGIYETGILGGDMNQIVSKPVFALGSYEDVLIYSTNDGVYDIETRELLYSSGFAGVITSLCTHNVGPSIADPADLRMYGYSVECGIIELVGSSEAPNFRVDIKDTPTINSMISVSSEDVNKLIKASKESKNKFSKTKTKGAGKWP
jgi:hypothetical protein